MWVVSCPIYFKNAMWIVDHFCGFVTLAVVSMSSPSPPWLSRKREEKLRIISFFPKQRICKEICWQFSMQIHFAIPLLLLKNQQLQNNGFLVGYLKMQPSKITCLSWNSSSNKPPSDATLERMSLFRPKMALSDSLSKLPKLWDFWTCTN